MSSAILYLAIVAIWAGVLIPRWLRNDAGQEPSSAPPQPGEAPVEPAAGWAGCDGGPANGVPRDGVPRDGVRDDDVGQEPVQRGPVQDERRARALNARRRLLWMLLVLAGGAGFIAVTRLAAWWVVVPPAIMLGGYLLLLREAAKADAERRLAEHTGAARTQRTRMEAQMAAYERSASGRPEAQGQPGVAGQPGEVASGTAGEQPAGPAQPAAAAEVLDISARVAQEPYDQYADAELRAVGDGTPPRRRRGRSWPAHVPPRVC